MSWKASEYFGQSKVYTFSTLGAALLSTTRSQTSVPALVWQRLNKVSLAVGAKRKRWPNWRWLISLFQAHAWVPLLQLRGSRILPGPLWKKWNKENIVLMSLQRYYQQKRWISGGVCPVFFLFVWLPRTLFLNVSTELTHWCLLRAVASSRKGCTQSLN